jgi:membrane protease YdiL (CAAX protease family)
MKLNRRQLSRQLQEAFLLTEDFRLGLVWRVAVYLFLFVIVIGISRAVWRNFDDMNFPLHEMAGGAIYFMAGTGGILAVTALVRKYLDRRPWRGIGLTRAAGGLPWMVLGWIAGCALIAVLFAVEYALGWVRIEGYGLAGFDREFALDWFIGTLVACLAVGVTEEIALRGYIFQNLGEQYPLWAASLATGWLFAAMHGDWGWGYFLGLVLISTFFILVRVGSGSIWFVIGFHGAWNWMQSGVCGLGLKYRPEAVSLIKVEETGPELWMGRGFAIEGGLIAIGIISAAMVCAWFYARRKRPGLTWNVKLDGSGEPERGAGD